MTQENGVRKAFNGAQWQGVSIRKRCHLLSLSIQTIIILHIAILVGLIIMMWPVLTKVQYETLPAIFASHKIWRHMAISIFLNWIVAPFIMLGLGEWFHSCYHRVNYNISTSMGYTPRTLVGA